MFQEKNKQVKVAGGMGIFFGCGHRFIEATENIPILSKELGDRLRCPLCDTHRCLVCSAPFSGWLDSCGSCHKFCEFEAVADEAISRGIHQIQLEFGIILVPRVGNEPSRVLDWPESLCLGVGYVEFDGETDVGGEIYATESMDLELFEILRLDKQRQSNVVLSGPLRMQMRIVNTDKT
ncbi:uncharacterized protein F4807DRAFT_6822 [Annulohypoxylon truncatum]|uniref:uncharacterized protein n=1 Tax=Annulohypoxylon truncatum TaxID=327061 RepID=UPI002007EF44|nr:uncharacterized protein F4807DRAFT_6822 [Annulohypoxylon truncatum]KAI1214710.1 hypothetical protein F4807DRAFT_6822 [Annulohypoxylon truncatum]